MSGSNDKPSFQEEVFALIEKEIGYNNLLTVPTSLIKCCGNLQEACFLSQLIYWTGKEKRADGFMFKSWQEWHGETGLSRQQLRTIRNRLETKGLLETKLRQANGNPTLHYRLNCKAFIDTFGYFLKKVSNAISQNQPIDCANSTNGLVTSNHSITETTPYPTSETTLLKKGDKGALREKTAKHYALSFSSYRKRYKPDPEIAESIAYFLGEYERTFREKHPRLRPEQWEHAVRSLQTSDYFDASAIEATCEYYFNIEYQDGCDYRLMHFVTPGVQEMLNYRLMHGE